MSDRLSKLIKSFSSYISVPWGRVLSAEERAIFVVYDKTDELKLRARVGEFEEVVRQSNHGWLLLDITNSFPEWLAELDYLDGYFEDPQYLSAIYSDFAEKLVEKLQSKITTEYGPNDIVALLGAGTLFGFTSVSGLVKSLSPSVQGRLVVFFPGEYTDNNYSLLDAKDGWGYQATAITATN